MSKEEIQAMTNLFPLLDKEILLKNLSKDDMYTLCECLHEEVTKWKEYTESARNQLHLLLGVKKTSKEFQKIFKDLV